MALLGYFVEFGAASGVESKCEGSSFGTNTDGASCSSLAKLPARESSFCFCTPTLEVVVSTDKLQMSRHAQS